MKDYEKNIPSHNNLLHFNAAENCWTENRLAFEGGAAPAEAPKGEQKPPEAEPPKQKTIDIHTTEFDNTAFKAEKQGSFDSKNRTIDRSIKELVDKIPNLSETDKNFLSTEFRTALVQKVGQYKDSIAESIKTISPVTYRNTNAPTINRELWFNSVLRSLKCTKIGMVHDTADDLTKFRFYSNSGEILFKQADIRIQYTPKTLEESAKKKETVSLQPQEVKVAKEQASNKIKTGAIDLFKTTYNQDPKEGDRLVLTKVWGGSQVKGHFDSAKGNFVSETGRNIWLHTGDKIKFYPKTETAQAAAEKVTIGTDEYIVLTRLDTDKSYLQVATEILEGKSNLPQAFVDRIKKTDITAVEYADLLRQAHFSEGKEQKLPIITPRPQTERRKAKRKSEEQKEAAQHKKTSQESQAKDYRQHIDQGIAEVKEAVKDDIPEVEERIKEFEAELAKIPQGSEKYQEAWEDFLSDIDDDFKEVGVSRDVTDTLVAALRQGKDRGTWREMWRRQNKTVERIMGIIGKNPAIFGKNLPKNTVRDRVYDLIWTGEAESFDTGDIIKAFGLKMPYPGWTYDQVLPLALANPNKITRPETKAAYAKCKEFVDAVEGLSRAIALLDPSATTDVVKSTKQYETLPDQSTPAKNLKKLIELLMVDSSDKITKTGEDEYACTVEKGGRRLKLIIEDKWNGQHISVRNPENNEKLFREFDHGSFDAQDYVEKINSLFSTGAQEKKVEQAEREKLPEMALSNVPTYFSLKQLDSLHKSIPGIPVAELLTIRNEKDEGVIQNNLTLKLYELLSAMGIYGSAKFIDTPENIKEIKGNDSALVNVRYKGKDMTMKFLNTTFGYDVFFEYGFNRECNKDTALHAYDKTGEFDLGEAHLKINQALHKIGWQSNADLMMTDNSVERTERMTVSGPAIIELNSQLARYDQMNGNRVNHGLTVAQFTEVLFRAYSFDELVKMGCIAKVAGTEKSYIIVNLPPPLKNVAAPENKPFIDLIYAIKYGMAINNDQIRHITSTSTEILRDTLNVNERYEKALKRIFAYGLNDYTEEGQKVRMEDTDSETMTDYSKDEFFKKTSGKAAYNDILEQVKSRTPDGTEIIDFNKLNALLTNIHQLGIARLRRIAKSNTYYREILKQYEARGERPFNPLVTDHIDNTILRLGYLDLTVKEEQEQYKDVEKMKAELIKGILSFIPDEVIGPDGTKISKEKAAAALNTLPIGVLLSYSYDQSTDTHVGGVHVPIVLDIFDTPHAKMVLVPGITSRGVSFAAGFSFTSRGSEWSNNSRVSFYGGVSLGLSAGQPNEEGGSNFGLGGTIGGGMDINIIKADDEDNFNYYFGFKASAGFDVLQNQYGINLGVKVIEWQIDAKQTYKNEYNAELNKEGIFSYVYKLKAIYEGGSKPAEVTAFCSEIKADPILSQKLGLDPSMSEVEILRRFEEYVADLTNKFNEDFDLPLVVAGEVSVGVVSGAIMASGAITGNVPVFIGGVMSWGIQVLASLQFNIASKMVVGRKRKTSEETMRAFGDSKKQEQFDKMFESFERSEAVERLYKSGTTTLNEGGTKRTTYGEEIKVGSESVSGDLSKIKATLGKFNESLVDKGIDLRLDFLPDNTIEIKLLKTSLDVNEKILISPDIVVMRGNRIFLKDPNNIQYLYFDQQNRKYPLETSHGATMERVVTISQNRFFSGDTFPTEVEISRYADNKDNPIINSTASTEAPKEYIEKASFDFRAMEVAQQRMTGALDQSRGEAQEKKEARSVEEIKALAKKIYRFRNSQRKTFMDITNKEALENEDNPDLVSEELYAHYEEYTTKYKVKPLNGYEKKLLTLELSTIRYTQLSAATDSPFARAEALKKRLEWCRQVVKKLFEKRIEELKKQGVTFGPDETAEKLSIKAMQDVAHLDTKMPITPLEKGTTAGIIIGRGGNGIHQLQDASGDDANRIYEEFGPIIGKDYSEAIRTGQPREEYLIGMLLKGQLSYLPEAGETEKFLDSNLARTLASNGGLAFILEPNEYNQVADYYQNKAIGQPGIQKFIALVSQIRQAQIANQAVLSVKGRAGIDVILKINTKVQAGIFSKCGNYTPTVTENITIIPPSFEEASLMLLANESNARTTITPETYKQFIGPKLGVTATVKLEQPDQPPEEGGGKESAGPQGETKTGSGDRESGQQTTPDRGTPTTDVPNAPPPTDVDNAGSEGF